MQPHTRTRRKVQSEEPNPSKSQDCSAQMRSKARVCEMEAACLGTGEPEGTGICQPWGNTQRRIDGTAVLQCQA